MTNERRPTHDLKILSIFLDDGLNASQKKVLEERLAREPELHQKLENLRRTKVLLAGLPRVKCPRNFTLTPDMVTVRQPRRSPLVTTLRLATSFAAILLVALFGFELLIGRGLTADRFAAEAPLMESMKFAEDAPPQPLIQWGATGGESGGRGGGADDHYGMGGGIYMAEEALVEVEALPADDMLEMMPIEEYPAEEDHPAEEEYPAEDLLTEELPAAEMESAMVEESVGMLAIEEGAEEELILGINLEQGGEIISFCPTAAHQDLTELSRISLLRWGQIILAAAVLAGILTLLFLRSRRTVWAR